MSSILRPQPAVAPGSVIPQAAQRILYLATRASFSSAVRKALGAPHLEALRAILSGPDMTDLDTLLMSGGIHIDQAEQYLHSFPQHAIVRRRMYEVADNMVQHLVTRLPELMQDLRNYSTTIRYLSELMDAFSIDQYATFRNGFLNEFLIVVLQNLFLKSCSFLRDANDEKTFADFMHYHDTLYDRNNGAEQGLVIDNRHLVYVFDETEAFFTPHVAPFASVRAEQQPASHDQEFYDLMRDDLIRLTEMNVVRSDLFEDGYFGFTVHPPREIARYSSFCTMTINPPGTRQAYLCYVDRSTGDIFMPKTQCKLDIILPPDMYNAFRHAVAEHLHTQLSVTEKQRVDEIARSFVPRRGSPDDAFDNDSAAFMSTTQETARAGSEGDQFDAEEAGFGAEVPDRQTPVEVWQYVRHETASVTPDIVSAPPSSVVTSQTSAQESLSRVQLMRCLPSIKAREIVAAFTKIIGPPVRVSGSHHIFSRNGISFPLAYHASESMPPGIVLRALKALGISAQELLDVL